MKIIVRPKKGESKEDAMAREASAHPNDELVWWEDAKQGDPSSSKSRRKRRGRRERPDSSDRGMSSSPSGGGGLYGAIAQRAIYPHEFRIHEEQQTSVTLPDGSIARSAYSYPPTLVNVIRVAIHEYSLFDTALWCNNSDATKTPIEVSGIQQRMNDYPRLLVNAVAFRGETMTSQVFPAGDITLQKYLNDFSIAYGLVRTILAESEAGWINPAHRQIVAAIGSAGILRRARTLWEQLNYFPIPPKWPLLLNELMGVFDSGDEDFTFIAYANDKAPAGGETDWTSSDQLRALLDVAQSHITALDVGSALSQFLQELFSRAYGPPKPFVAPAPMISRPCWDLHYLGVSYLNEIGSQNYSCVPSITPQNFSANSVTVQGGVVPILVRHGVGLHPLTFTLFRPAFYDGFDSSSGFDPSGNRNVVGLLNTGNQDSTSERIYTNPLNTGLNNTVQNDALNDAQLAGGVFNVVGRAGSSMWDTRWWKPITYSTLIGDGNANWLFDTRSYSAWDYYPIAPYNFRSTTEKILDDCFVGPDLKRSSS